MSELDDQLRALARQQHGLVTLDQVRSHGGDRHLAKRRVNAGRWRRASPAVYALGGSPSTWHQRVLAQVLATGGIASHRAAAALHGLAGFDGDVVELTVRRHERIRPPGVQYHETLYFDSIPTARPSGIPSTAVERTLVDLAGILGRGRLQRLMDASLREGTCTAEQIADAIATTPSIGHPGLAKARACLALAAGGHATASDLEDRYLAILERARFPPLERQVIVRDHDGVAIIRADFGVRAAKIAVEVDSVKFHGQSRYEHDRRARHRARVLGWIVVEATEHQIHHDHPGAVRELVDAFVARGLWLPPHLVPPRP